MNVIERARAVAAALSTMTPAPLAVHEVREPLDSGHDAVWFEVQTVAADPTDTGPEEVHSVATFCELVGLDGVPRDQANADGFVALHQHAGAVAAAYIELHDAVRAFLSAYRSGRQADELYALETMIIRLDGVANLPAPITAPLFDHKVGAAMMRPCPACGAKVGLHCREIGVVPTETATYVAIHPERMVEHSNQHGDQHSQEH
mgnify:FL=1